MSSCHLTLTLTLIIDPLGTHTQKKKHLVMQPSDGKQNCRHFLQLVIFVESPSQDSDGLEPKWDKFHIYRNENLSAFTFTCIGSLQFSLSCDKIKLLKEIARKQTMKIMTAIFPPAFRTFCSELDNNARHPVTAHPASCYDAGVTPNQGVDVLDATSPVLTPLLHSSHPWSHRAARFWKSNQGVDKFYKRVVSCIFLSCCFFMVTLPSVSFMQVPNKVSPVWDDLCWSTARWWRYRRCLRLCSSTEKVPALAALLNPLTFLLSSQEALSGGLRAEPSAALCNIPRINVLRCCGWKTSGCIWFLTINLPASTTTAPW